MNSLPLPADLQAVRDYVTAKDGYEYADTQDFTVVLNIHHNLLKTCIAEIRLEKHMTIAAVKEKVYRHCGTKPDSMELTLLSAAGEVLAALNDDTKKLGYYSVAHGMTLYVKDTDPFSLAKGGGLEDVSLVEKYVMSEEDYDKRKKTVRQYKRDQLAKDPNWKPPVLMGGSRPKKVDPATLPGPESVANINIDDRCEVMPGGRRGRVAFVGEIPELGGGGFWIGVRFDEPVAKGNGTVKGTTYFECNDKHGGFIRPGNVNVGDYPEEDPFDISDDEDEL